jgi:hypothetical protein
VASYAEMAQEHKKARSLYLEIRSLDLDLRVRESPRDPSGYDLSITGLRSVSPAHADRLRRRVQECKPGLVKVLQARWDADLMAVRCEGETGKGG